jgi:hypothetical protein
MRCAHWLACMLVCVLCAQWSPARAQLPAVQPTLEQPAPAEVQAAQAAAPSSIPVPSAPLASAPTARGALPESDVQSELTAVRSELQHAQFEVSEQRARELLARSTLTARERNDTLELLAIAQIAARHEQLAQATLSELFARDPEHPQRMRDPGPNVEAFFARVRAQNHPSLAVALEVRALRDPSQRLLIEVRLGTGRDAVDSVHVLTSAEGEQATDPLHVLADVGLRERLLLTLPQQAPDSQVLALYVEARAPSGYLLGHDGSAAAPLRVRLDQPVVPAREIRPTSLGRTWWLWTSVAVVVAGAGVTGALLAH